MSTDRIIVTDLYLRRTQSDTRKVAISHHWVWNGGRNFLDSQQREQSKLAKEGKTFQIIEPATLDDYRAFAWPTTSPK